MKTSTPTRPSLGRITAAALLGLAYGLAVFLGTTVLYWVLLVLVAMSAEGWPGWAGDLAGTLLVYGCRTLQVLACVVLIWWSVRREFKAARKVVEQPSADAA